jgi:hypothetical protein
LPGVTNTVNSGEAEQFCHYAEEVGV